MFFGIVEEIEGKIPYSLGEQFDNCSSAREKRDVEQSSKRQTAEALAELLRFTTET